MSSPDAYHHSGYSAENEESHDNEGSSSSRPASPPREYAVYIRDIARGTSQKMLKDFFEKNVGRVYSVNLIRNKQTGETRGFGFARFYTKEDTYKAVDLKKEDLPSFRDVVSNKKYPIRISLADPKNVLYVGDLPKDLNQEQARALVEQIGKTSVKKFELIYTPEGNSKGFAWVTYETHQSAIIALKHIETSTEETRLSVSFADPRVYDERELPRVKILSVANLGSAVTDESLEQLFGGSSVVQKIELEKDSETQKPTGFGLVHFHDHDKAKEVMEKMQGKEIEGLKLSIDWSMDGQITQRAKPARVRQPEHGRNKRGRSRSPPADYRSEHRGRRENRDYRDTRESRDYRDPNRYHHHSKNSSYPPAVGSHYPYPYPYEYYAYYAAYGYPAMGTPPNSRGGYPSVGRGAYPPAMHPYPYSRPPPSSQFPPSHSSYYPQNPSSSRYRTDSSSESDEERKRDKKRKKKARRESPESKHD